VELVAANVGAPRWPRIGAALVLILSFAGAALVWRRGAAAPATAPSPKATPAAGSPTIPSAAIPEMPLDQARSGRVAAPLPRTGSVSTTPRPAGAPPPPPPDPTASPDPRIEEYRSLFAEFVRLRITTGESVDDLDAAQFVATLREKRAQIMKQIPV